MITPYLPMSTFPGSDIDVPPVQNWYYVMVENGPDEGPFWQWAKNAKNKTKNAANINNSKATLWEWHLIQKRWYRILWYEPGSEHPYLDDPNSFYNSTNFGESPNVDPTVGTTSDAKQDTTKKGVPWGPIGLGVFVFALVGGLVVWAKKESEEEEKFGPIVVRG